MDDQQVGIRIRTSRVRHGWTQAELARRARLSHMTVSRLERGHVSSMSVAAIRAVAAVLEIRVELITISRAGDLERLVRAGHSALADRVVAILMAREGWTVRPEVSFNVFGERGVVDLLAWHEPTQTLIVIEIKTEIVDVGELLGTLDRKARLALTIAADLGWRPRTVATWLVVADTMTNRRRIAAHAATFRAAFPVRGRAMAAWLRQPVGSVRALSFLSNEHPGSVRGRLSVARRVRPRRSSVAETPGARRRSANRRGHL
jgi:transcriptional regulator with XRE-family HTH domain